MLFLLFSYTLSPKHFSNFPIFYSRYEVEFSKPKETKPIPEGTVKVYFNIVEGIDSETHEVEEHVAEDSEEDALLETEEGQPGQQEGREEGQEG